MEEIKVKIINKSHHPLPAYATPGSAGMDIRAFLPDGTVTVAPGERVLIPTGLYIELPHGFEAQIRPRSGLALRHGITIPNTPGTIDADYRGEIKVILLNAGQEPFEINDGERVCQMVINHYVRTRWEETTRLDHTERGDGGFGHSGTE